MQPGFCIIHANQLETLAQLLVAHSSEVPLAPLEPEICLVQSNGMADWLKLQQANLTGISASMEFPMPASFLWRMYQRVLHPSLLDAPSPFAKDSLQWRLLRLLPELLDAPEFARPRHFLDGDVSQTKRFQLARKLADLFDQYQLYRADWIKAWEAGRLLGLGADEAWQASLWRALIASLPEAEQQLSRAHLHAAFLDALQGDERPAGLPRRLFLFGINSMPQQLLEALHAMSRHCQLLLMILSPCREYWGDKGVADLDSFAASNPLLDSWGAQGRDFLRLLQSVDASEQALSQVQEINPYADADEHTRADSIICQLQQSLLDNCLPPSGQRLPPDPGLAFYPAYSRQREVEVLHDKLLTLFATDASLQYGEVVVMMPNIDAYVPHIEAVFGRYPLEDGRRLSYSISDRSAADAPLFVALDYLLSLPSQRLALSEVMSLLALPAVLKAQGMTADDLTQLQDWCAASHIRWALDASHKQQLLELPADASSDWRAHNTWQAGLDQLLAGYCAGSADIFSCASVDEVTAGGGALLGQLTRFIDTLARLRQQLAHSQTPADWATLFSDLLDTCFVADSDDERLLISQLSTSLDAWLADCALAAFDDVLPLAQARQGWLDQLAAAGMSQQLSFNGITFCTLMPMRALPFKQVFLLGMNDGDYPHATTQVDFDLMQDDYRPGDRDRRNDDQYLFLEALMSVRDSLHISWIGRDISKNEDRPPCTLVAQLRDLVDHCWQTSLVDKHGKSISASAALTQQLPLAAFGERYFLPADTDADLPCQQMPRTYAHEWFSLYRDDAATTDLPTLPDTLPSELQARHLADLLKSPDKVFREHRLQARLDTLEDDLEDDEPFAASGLTLWQLRSQLLQDLQNGEPSDLSGWKKSGVLPPGELTQTLLRTEQDAASSIYRRTQEHLQGATPAPRHELLLTLHANNKSASLVLSLNDLWQQQDGLLLVDTSASNLYQEGWRIDKLASFWIRHLSACAAGLGLHSRLVARDKQVHLAPLSAKQAQARLNQLFLLYQAAWQQPLVLPQVKGQTDEAFDLDALSDAKLLTAIHDHWPDAADTNDKNKHNQAFFDALLHAPLLAALAGDKA